MQLPTAIHDEDNEQARAMQAMVARDLEASEEFETWRPKLEAALEAITAECRARCQQQSAPFLKIEGRVKKWPKLLPKLQEGLADPWDTCSDLLGVRIVVLSVDEVEQAHAALSGLVKPGSLQEQHWYSTSSKARGYHARHLELCISDDLSVPQGTNGAELQIVTAMQDAWGTFSHDDFYKASVGVPLELSKRVLRLAAVMNLVDQELQDIRKALEPDVRNRFGEVAEIARLPSTRVVLDEVSLVASASGPLRDEFVELKQLGRNAGFRPSGWSELVRPRSETDVFLGFAADAGISSVADLKEACHRAMGEAARLREVVTKIEKEESHSPLFDRPLHVLQTAEMLRVGHAIKSPFRDSVTRAIHAVINES